jgi:hypothetical protein
MNTSASPVHAAEPLRRADIPDHLVLNGRPLELRLTSAAGGGGGARREKKKEKKTLFFPLQLSCREASGVSRRAGSRCRRARQPDRACDRELQGHAGSDLRIRIPAADDRNAAD